jgi:hypothetical protein
MIKRYQVHVHSIWGDDADIELAINKELEKNKVSDDAVISINLLHRKNSDSLYEIFAKGGTE